MLCNIPPTTTPNRFSLSIPGLQFVALQRYNNDQSWPAVLQYSLLQVCCTSTCYQQSLLTSYYSVFIVAGLGHFNVSSTITTNQLLLSIPCSKLVALQLVINDHSQPDVTQYSLLQACCTSACYQRSLLTSCYSIFLVLSLLYFILSSTIIPNQLLLCIPCFKFVVLLLSTPIAVSMNVRRYY